MKNIESVFTISVSYLKFLVKITSTRKQGQLISLVAKPQQTPPPQQQQVMTVKNEINFGNKFSFQTAQNRAPPPTPSRVTRSPPVAGKGVDILHFLENKTVKKNQKKIEKK